MGGVICLNLGVDKPSDFDDILAKIKEIRQNKYHAIVSVYDTVLSRYLGDCEYITEEDGTFIIQQVKVRNTEVIDFYKYYFGTDGTYLRRVNSIEINK